MSYTIRSNEKNMVEPARAVCYMCKHAFMDRSGPVTQSEITGVGAWGPK